GPHLGDLAKNGEAAEPGIKDENGRGHGGRWYEKNGRRAMSGRGVAGRPSRGGAGASCGTRAERRAPRPYLRALSGDSHSRKIVGVRHNSSVRRPKPAKPWPACIRGTRRGCSKPKTSV